VTKASIQVALREAKAFVTQAQDVLDRNKSEWIETSKYSGSLRRQSMELTRVLAEMRRP
jgi:hypothetical protein